MCTSCKCKKKSLAHLFLIKLIFRLTMDETQGIRHAPPINMLPPTPAGLESLYSLCRRIYPDQINPLQVTALLKYW